MTKAHVSTENIDQVVDSQFINKYVINQRSIHERKVLLNKFAVVLNKFRKEIQIALFEDFKKPFEETDLTELWPVLMEIRHARRNLFHWAQPESVGTPLAMMGTNSSIHHEPKGTVLIISPWNFPINLTFCPLVSALAAGNNVILKPSEMTPHASQVMERIVKETFAPEEVTLIQGGAEEAKLLLTKPFDHIFFTGSPAVGKIVMTEAAKNLTPVTLELGGKSPVIIDGTADLEDAAEKIAWGKFLNNGQTCIAPDYILIDKRCKTQFIKYLTEAIENLFSQSPEDSHDYGRIVNDKHHQRLQYLLKDALEKGAEVIYGGKHFEKYFSPTILHGIKEDMKIIQEEIFGPILPILTFDTLEHALEMIKRNANPLAAYIFTKTESVKNKVIQELKAGGVSINECVLHFAHSNLPFGGHRMSGMGRSHGVYGFKEFSNVKPVLRQKTGWTNIKILYPPFNSFKRRLLNLLLKYF